MIVRRKRSSVTMPLAGAGSIFLTFLAFVIPLLHAIQHGIVGGVFRLGGLSTSVTFSITVAAGIVIAYIPSRMIFRSLQWETFDYDGTYCLKCDYSLTGNVSGICPECGTAIPGTVADRRAHDAAQHAAS